MLTLPKSIDASIIRVDRCLDQNLKPSIDWTSLRRFVDQASFAAVHHGIFIPPLYREQVGGEPTTSGAMTPNALNWSVAVMRRMGREVELYDSLHGLINHLDGPEGRHVSEDIRSLVEFYIEKAMSIARSQKFCSTDDWGAGLFKDFDFHIASAILAFRYGTTAENVLDAMGFLDCDGDAIGTYYDFAAGRAPHEFVNAVASELALVESQKEVFVLPPRIGDEFRALHAIISRETKMAGREYIPVEFERCLGLVFDPSDDPQSQPERVPGV